MPLLILDCAESDHGETQGRIRKWETEAAMSSSTEGILAVLGLVCPWAEAYNGGEVPITFSRWRSCLGRLQGAEYGKLDANCAAAMAGGAGDGGILRVG